MAGFGLSAFGLETRKAAGCEPLVRANFYPRDGRSDLCQPNAMITREYAACEECETAHILRIGIGAEPTQAHQFSCSNCGEEMNIRLERGIGFIYGPNASKIDPIDDGPIVNLHPSFVFSKDDVGRRDAFPSLEFGAEMIKGILAARAKAGLSLDLAKLTAESSPTARITEEWEQLRAAWSLTRNGKTELAEKRRLGFVDSAGYPEPPDSLPEWVFQFAGRLIQPRFEEIFEGLFEQVRIAKDKPDFGRFIDYYSRELSADHGRRYFEVCKAYLGAFSEFSQVHYLVTTNVNVGDDHAAASTNFKSTRMFYGDAFEAFGNNIEVLVALNNLVEDRPFDELRTISFEKYRGTDKAGRCNALADNPAMAAVCGDFDNQIRNASHHGGMVFDSKSGSIEYRAGKGGQGEIHHIGYATYLARCTLMFVQLMNLFRIEIFIANQFGGRLPL